MKIKTGDQVRVIAGKNKGKDGKVLQVLAERNQIVIEGVNEATKHIKRRGNQPGQKVNYNAPIHVSNVRVIGKNIEGRIGYKILETDGKRKKIRIVKSKKGTEDLS